MSWLINFFTSSIGRKLIMSLTGLFLIVFLLVHLIGNFQLLVSDGGQAFNEYAKFMTTNPLIKTTSYGLYAFIVLHAVQGIAIWAKNRSARGQKYAVKKTRAVGTSAAASSNMALLGTIVLVFLFLHMGDFWWAMKWDAVPMADCYDGDVYQDLYAKVYISFKQPWIVVAYLVGLVGLAFHLLHGFQSAFQTLGINHKKYTPLIRGLGWAYSILVPLGFAAMPLFFYFMADIPDADIAKRIGEFTWWIN